MRAKLTPFRESITSDPKAMADRMTELVRVVNEIRGQYVVTVQQPVEKDVPIVLRPGFKVASAVVGGVWTLDGSALPTSPTWVYQLTAQQDGSTLVRLKELDEGRKYAVALVLYGTTEAG